MFELSDDFLSNINELKAIAPSVIFEPLGGKLLHFDRGDVLLSPLLTLSLLDLEVFLIE